MAYTPLALDSLALDTPDALLLLDELTAGDADDSEKELAELSDAPDTRVLLLGELLDKLLPLLAELQPADDAELAELLECCDVLDDERCCDVLAEVRLHSDELDSELPPDEDDELSSSTSSHQKPAPTTRGPPTRLTRCKTCLGPVLPDRSVSTNWHSTWRFGRHENAHSVAVPARAPVALATADDPRLSKSAV